ALRNMGETPSSIIKKATGLVESSQTLRPPGANASAADDFFVGNVKNQIDLKRMKAGKDPVDWNKPLKKPVSDDLPPGTSRSGQKPLTRGKASFAKEVDAAEFAGKALQYTAQGIATTTAVSGKISEKGSQRLRDGKEWSLEDSAEVAVEGARSLPVTIMAEAMTMTGYEKSRKLSMEIEKKEQELQQAERRLAAAQAPDGPRDPRQIQAARQRVEEARKNLNDAWVQFAQETQGYYDPNQTIARIVQGKDTYVTDLADKAGKAVVETAKGLSNTLEDVTKKNFDEMWANAEKEGRRPTMGEGAEFYLKTGRDFASELGPRQAVDGLYDIATAWEADRAEIGAQKDLGEAFDRRFSYQESRLKHTQRELEQLLSQGDSKDPDVQQRKQELLARYRAHYDTIQKIPDLAGKYLNDPELRMRQIDAAMNKIHPSGKPQNLDEKLKEPATRQRWFELIDARKKLIQQAEGETHLTEEDRKRLANLRDKAGRLVQPDVLGEYAQDMLPDPYDHSTDGEGQSNRDDVSTVAGQAGQDKKDGFTFLDEGDTRSLERGQRVADAMDADGGFVFLRGETKPGGDANKEEISREDKAQVVEMSRRHGKESGAGFTFVGEEKAQADQVSRKNARAGGEFADPDDPETQQALKIVEDARRNPPSRPGWEIELDRHEQDYQRQMRASRLDMARSFHDMSRIIGRISHDSRKKRSRQKQSTSERKLPHRPKPVGSIGNRTKAQDIPRFRFEPSPETAWSYEEVSNASGRKPSASNTPPIKYSSGNTGSAMSWDACVEKHCPMCANQVTLLEVTPSDECNKCKKTKYAAIKACSSGNARRRQGVTVNKQAHSGVNKGAKVYFAARKYQPKYKNYHYVIGKKQYGGLVGHQILFGPDTYMGCRRWLIGKGYWK
ncbi:MAG: hypothetical protein PVJ19_22705, partial [Desulfobacteraceae bacterium]